MDKYYECKDGACAVDFTKETKTKEKFSFEKEHIIAGLSLFFLLLGVAFNFFEVEFFTKLIRFVWFGSIYIVIGGPVLFNAFNLIVKGKIYNEFVLMSVATLGAFFIGSYEEGVAVMIFYIVGQIFQELAIDKAKRSIESLLKVQSNEVTVLENGNKVIKHPKDVKIGQIIQIKPGQKIALDGLLISNYATLNSSALTGESVPDSKEKGDVVLAGMVNLNTLIEVEVSSEYEDTKLSKILKLVQEAVGKKAKTQQLISRLANIYTPIVFWLAIALLIIPFFFLGVDYEFQIWLQRALIFLVISCPCALVISIPLGYFGGIGAGSHNGILFKGSNYLDIITKVDTVVMDKTGTLTEGTFHVEKVFAKNFDENLLLKLTASLESNSTHPIAEAIVDYYGNKKNGVISLGDEIEEIPGYGMKGIIDGYTVLAGNIKLLEKFNISFDESLRENKETLVVISINGEYVGYITIADKLKEDAILAITELRKIKKIMEIIMLSGDKQLVVDKIAKNLGLTRAIGGLLPEDKINEVEKLKKQGKTVAFIGDGINDAPVITMADVGMAMGGLGSDAAIETADVIIQTDQPSKIATAIHIGNKTKNIIWQNISLALVVKILVLVLGAIGMATMWEAVIADVGVALLAILNSIRIQKMQFN